MSYVVSTAIADTLVLRDSGNTALTGKVAGDFATLEAYLLTTPATTATVALTEVGAGEYTVTFTPSVAGFWVLHAVYDSGGVFREWTETYLVDASASSSAVSTVSDLFVLRDNGNTAITGKVSADFATVEAYVLTNPALTAATTLTEIGSGEYRVTFTPSSVADWVIHVVYNSGGVFREWTSTWPVTSLSSSTIVIAGASAFGLTRRQLRQRIADRFEDLVMLTATSNGTATTFLDAFNVSTASEHYNGRVLWFTSGSNDGLQSRVTTTSGSTLTFTPAVTIAPVTGSTAEAYNRRGLGFTPDQYHRALNNAIADGNYIGMISAVATISGTFDADTPEVTIPASIVRIDTLEAQDENGDWTVVPPARTRGGDGWFADKGLGQIRIMGNAARQADGKALRVHGKGLHPSLASDTDTAALSWGEYLVARAAYHLAFGAIHKHDSFGQMVTIFQQESERLRTRIKTYRDPNEKGGRSV